MSTSLGVERTLNASDTLTLAPGQGLAVDEGRVLVFVLTSDDRRLPLAETATGGILASCARGADGERLLITGLPGTHVRIADLGRLIADDAGPALDDWLARLSAAGRPQGWDGRPLSVGADPITLADGEQAALALTESLSELSVKGWIAVQSGTARWNGWTRAGVAPGDGPIPMTRDDRLTAIGDCTLVTADGPRTVAEWTAAVDLAGRRAMGAVAERRATADAEREGRLLGERSRMQRATSVGVGAIAAALVRHPPHDGASVGVADADLDLPFEVLRAGGVTIAPDTCPRALAEIEAGSGLLVAVAQTTGTATREIDLGGDWQRHEGPPLVAATTDGRLLGLVRRGRRWMVIDPAQGLRRRPLTEADLARLTGRATEFIATLPAHPVRWLDVGRLALRGSTRELIVIATMTALIGLLSFVTPWVLGHLAASLLTMSPDPLLLPLGALVLVVLAISGWQAVRGLALLRLRTRGSAIAAGVVWDRVMRLRVTWFGGRGIGQLITQATVVNTAATTVPDLSLTRLLDTVVVLGSLMAVATTTPSLLVGLVALALVQVSVSAVLVRRGARLTTERVRASARSGGLLIGTLRAVDRLRVFGAQDRAFMRWAMAQAELTEKDIRLRRITLAQSVISAAWPLIALVVVVAGSALSSATFGDFVTAQTAGAAIVASVAAAAAATGAIANGRAILGIAQPILDAVPEGRGVGSPPGILSGELSVRGLTFRYSPEGPQVLDGVSFSVSPGEQVAIVGASGCGKTTLLRILLGLETPEAGVVAVDGKDMGSLDQPALRRQIGCVLQTTMLLPGKIRDNVSMGRNLTSDEIWAALEAASIADDVRALKMGIDTPVSDGGSISGGQRQRILIARALAGQPRMLVLDEATSALDNVTQAAVICSLEQLRITRIVVAHRLSTIRNADRVIVIDQGRAVASGTFDELMAVPGLFRDLAERQLTGVELT